MLLTSLILPLFSEEGKPVQNMWGDQQFPTDASFLEKVALGSRDVLGAYVPSTVSATAGLATGALPEEQATGVIETLPYTGRKFGYAQRGKSSKGTGSASTIETSRLEKLLKAGLSLGAGVQVTPVNLNAVKDANDKMNK
jgi:hypothetical protein